MADEAQVEWTRVTPWRQGFVINAASAAELGFVHPTSPARTCVVVVSHDCDLAIDDLNIEPEVEVIVGSLVDAVNGNYAWGKAPRTLHLPMNRAGAEVVVALVATSKDVVSKSVLAKHAPNADFVLDPKGLSVLRNWLGARYNRTAFPDEFANRMKSTKLDVKLVKLLEPHGQLISFVYFDIDGGELVERKEGDPYELSIVVVFNPGEDPDDAANRADDVAEAVAKGCVERLATKDGAPNKNIRLKACFPMSEDDLAVSKARVLMQWRLEYLSLRADDGQPGPPA